MSGNADDKGIKGADGDDEDVAEKLSDFFVAIFTAEAAGHLSNSAADQPEEPEQLQVKR